MKKNILIVLLLIVCISGCSSTENIFEQMNTSNGVTDESNKPLITYEVAFDFISEAEEVIVNNNKYTFNELNESTAEKIIYSDEYAALFCSYWKALEELEGENDSRFGKSKMRWQVDFSNEKWTNLLKEKLETEGIETFQDEYYRIYNEKVFPKIEKRWNKKIF